MKSQKNKPGSVCFTALPDVPLVNEGDDIVSMILTSLKTAEMKLEHQDILVIAQKIISKAEGRLIELNTVTPSPRALEIAEMTLKDPRLVELILSESTEVLRIKKGDKTKQLEGLIIVRHRLGYVLAQAGIDQSNVPQEPDRMCALLLPKDPDGSCLKLRDTLYQLTNANVGVLINDSHGRLWREGTVGVTLGVSGVPAILDLRGNPDLFARELKTTQVGFADEISAGASLLMGQSGEGTPIVHIRGLHYSISEKGSEGLIRPSHMDLFR